MFAGVGRLSGHRVLVAGTAAASLVAMQPAASDLSRHAIELHNINRAVKKSSLVTVDCA